MADAAEEGDASMTVESHVWRGGRSLSAADRLSSADSLSSADNLSAADSPSAADHLSMSELVPNYGSDLGAESHGDSTQGSYVSEVASGSSRRSSFGADGESTTATPQGWIGLGQAQPLDLASLEIDEDNRSEATLRRHYSGSTQLADEDQRGPASPESPGERQAWIDERRAIHPRSVLYPCDTRFRHALLHLRMPSAPFRCGCAWCEANPHANM